MNAATRETKWWNPQPPIVGVVCALCWNRGHVAKLCPATKAGKARMAGKRRRVK